MKRTGFASRVPRREPTQSTYTPRPRAVAVSTGEARMSVPIPKENQLRDESYRRLVASLPCAHCGRPGPSQAAHADMGKGMGIKSSDATCYPLCADAPGRRGCHALIGSDGMFSRDQRRALEARYAEKTRQMLAAGPAGSNWK